MSIAKDGGDWATLTDTLENRIHMGNLADDLNINKEVARNRKSCQKSKLRVYAMNLK